MLPDWSFPIDLGCSPLSWDCWSLQQGSSASYSALPSPSSCPAPLQVWFSPVSGPGGGWWHKGKGQGPILSHSFCVQSKTIPGHIRCGQISRVLLNRWRDTKSILCWVLRGVSSDGEACTPAGRWCLMRYRWALWPLCPHWSWSGCWRRGVWRSSQCNPSAKQICPVAALHGRPPRCDLGWSHTRSCSYQGHRSRCRRPPFLRLSSPSIHWPSCFWRLQPCHECKAPL